MSLALSVSGQTLSPVKADFDAYVPLLQKAGYNVFSYDISQLADTTYNIKLVTKEYKDREMIDSGEEIPFYYSLTNRTMLSAFNKEVQEKTLPEEMDDAEKGIYRIGRRLNIGLSPLNDTLRNVSMAIPGQGMINMPTLKLYSQCNPKTGKHELYYSSRPFKPSELKDSTFIPLVLFGASWWDSKYEFFRFCGEKEILPDMSGDILKNSPHYYIIGIEAIKQKD